MITESININIIVIDDEYRYSMVDAKDCLVITKTEEYKTKSKEFLEEAILNYINNNLKELVK
jgi:hypothetical protein